MPLMGRSMLCGATSGRYSRLQSGLIKAAAPRAAWQMEMPREPAAVDFRKRQLPHLDTHIESYIYFFL